MKTDLWLLAALYFGGAVDAAISSNYTEALLSSGTVKLGDWQDAYDKASQFVSSLSTTDKISIITGGSAGNFSGLVTLDSSSNPIDYYFVTAWPAGLAMSMTWDKDAITGQGKALGAEFKGKGVNVAFAPTVQPLGRSAWAGRTGETYGPDSFLAGIMSGAMAKGMAMSGVTPSAKHYILNEQETNRQGSTTGGGGGGGGGMPGGDPTTNGTDGGMPSIRRRQNSGNTTSSSSEAYSAVVDDKTFHETYLAPFYDTVKAGVGGVMCSMQRINGSYGCENQDTLGRYLKVELGFPGFVHPDAGAQHTDFDSANAGLDYGSSSYWSNSTLIAGIANGTFTEARLDDMATRVLISYFRQSQESYPAHAGFTDDVDVRQNHSALARTYAANSIALLKNTNNALPLKNRRSISIFGIHAAPRYVGPNTALSVMSGVGPTMDGHMTQVGGSAMSSAAFIVTPVHAFVERAMKDGFMLRWWLNDTVTTSQSGMMVSNGAGTELVETTVGVTANSDACVVFLNAWSGEGGDRSELANADQDYLVNTVADNCNNTIVVVNTNGPRLLDQWATHENVTGILYGGPLGQSSGHAINDILFGDVNPSGKLVHTIAKNESDYDSGTAISEESEIQFTEGNFIDYKYFDQKNITPRYEFGYGLSYTTFDYGDSVEISPDTEKLSSEYATGSLAVGGREDLWDIVAEASISLTNSGDIAGAEIAQLYVEFPSAADEPIRQLRGFQKVMIEAGSTEKATFQLRRRDLSIWDVETQEWAIVRGDYILHVGASSRDLKVSGTITV
ncbi:glycoside hydrolase family 3 protein [Dothidotthia symphoricarpi CBS 119687]|uniref:beta-glucosidase n=1 Tax=Dothidotthia symphoricarpi CBS 119687 TaxID=1392245 RepID=A0A6A6ADR2_9PLEO|nr:glycoside hydrolase family 3 protein [Dothidotthia symphoricarpi CBS 119687]KAF2129979.1 glycoside hydrolase family 3 protein [Dothidotthia symphoricarpi CBS 119687]